MVNLTAPPRSPLLAPFVKSFHYHETNLPFGLERIVPNGQAHLMVNLAEDEFRTYDRVRPDQVSRNRGAVLAGPHAQSVVLDTHQMRWLAAVQFRAGGAAHFLSMPMTEICNQVVGLGDLWHSGGSTLRERLIEAPTPQARFNMLEEMLIEHIQKRFDPAIFYAVSALDRGLPVSQVAHKLGLLPKAFVRRFAATVGITPKRFARVRRLQRVMRSIRTAAPPDWSQLALRHGYADQSHLVHEFRQLADITPTGYKPHSSRRNNHIPIPAQ